MTIEKPLYFYASPFYMNLGDYMIVGQWVALERNKGTIAGDLDRLTAGSRS